MYIENPEEPVRTNMRFNVQEIKIALDNVYNEN